MGVGQVGCSPSELAQHSPNGASCVGEIDSAIQIFNGKLQSMVVDFNNNLPGAKFAFINGFHIFQDIVRRAPEFGTY